MRWQTAVAIFLASFIAGQLAYCQGERSVKATGPFKVSKVFVADVLALRQRM